MEGEGEDMNDSMSKLILSSKDLFFSVGHSFPDF